MKIIIIIAILILSSNLFSKNKLDDKSYEIFLLKASNDLATKNYNNALTNLKESLLNKPESSNIKLYLAMFLAADKQYVKSLILLFKAKELENNELANFYKYYNYYFIQKGLEKDGKVKFSNIKNFLLKNNKTLGKDKLLFLAVTTYLNDDKNSSILFFKEAIKKDENILSLEYKINFAKDIVYDIYKHLSPPYDFYYYNSLGKLQISFNNNKEAIETLNKALKLDKKKFLTKKLLANAYLNLKDYNKALKYTLEIKKFYSNKEDIYLNLVKIYNEQKKFKQLFTICKEGLQMIPNSKDLRYCVAKGLNKNKKYREALYNLEYLLNQYPDSYEINFLMGNVLENFAKAISLESEPYKQKAMGLDYLKKFKTPIEYYSLAFRLNPISHEVIRKILGSMTDDAIKRAGNVDEKTKESFREKTINDFAQYYEPFVIRETLELNNVEFYKKFIKYLKTKSDSYIKEMKYLEIGKTILSYIEFLKKQSDKDLFKKFMSKYSKNYIKILNQKYSFNQFLYEFNFEKINKKIEQFKIYDFMIPSYFD